MSPRLAFLLALAGVSAAGIPLFHLTRPPVTPRIEAAPSSEAPSTMAYATLQFTGAPQSLVLRLEGKDLAQMPEGTPSPWELQIALPTDSQTLDIEVEAHWDEPGAHAATLAIEPPGRETRRDTQWSKAGMLHSVFTFIW